MSQEVLFFLFMIVELCAILLLYQVIIIPKIALKTNSLFEKRMMDKTWNIPAMLEDYTEHLTVIFSEIIKTLVPQVVAEFLDELPAPARMVANMMLPRIQEALSKSAKSPEEATPSYKPGLDKR